MESSKTFSRENDLVTNKNDLHKKAYLLFKLKMGSIEYVFPFFQKLFMKNFTTYLSTAPVVGTIWFIFTAGLIIEINRFFPDPLIF